MKYTEEIPRYKKKSKAKPPKKSKHKHMYEPCVIERPVDWYMKEHERSGVIKAEIGMYCPVCGKAGSITDVDRWYQKEPTQSKWITCRTIPTEECILELDPTTRTLPTFWTDEIFPKFFKLE